ncbi:MAG: hypothetical protein WD672_06180 [Woeseia sp.]
MTNISEIEDNGYLDEADRTDLLHSLSLSYAPEASFHGCTRSIEYLSSHGYLDEIGDSSITYQDQDLKVRLGAFGWATEKNHAELQTLFVGLGARAPAYEKLQQARKEESRRVAEERAIEQEKEQVLLAKQHAREAAESRKAAHIDKAFPLTFSEEYFDPSRIEKCARYSREYDASLTANNARYAKALESDDPDDILWAKNDVEGSHASALLWFSMYRCTNEMTALLNEVGTAWTPEKQNTATNFRDPVIYGSYTFSQLDFVNYHELQPFDHTLRELGFQNNGFDEWAEAAANKPERIARWRQQIAANRAKLKEKSESERRASLVPCQRLEEDYENGDRLGLLAEAIAYDCTALVTPLLATHIREGLISRPLDRRDGSKIDPIVLAHQRGSTSALASLAKSDYSLTDEASAYFREAVFSATSGPDEAVVDELIQSGLFRSREAFASVLMKDAVIGGRMRIAKSLSVAGLANIPAKPANGIKTVSIDERAIHFNEAAGYRCQGNAAEYLICSPIGRNGVFDSYASVPIDSARIEFYKGKLASIYLYYIDCGGRVYVNSDRTDDRSCTQIITDAVSTKYGKPTVTSIDGTKEFSWADPSILVTVAPKGFKAVSDPVYERYQIRGFYTEINRGVVQFTSPGPASALTKFRQKIADDEAQAEALQDAELEKQQQAQAVADREDL